MVLMSPRRERQQRVLATAAVSSGGRSGLGGVVPVDLHVRKTKKRAHELRDSTVKL